MDRCEWDNEISLGDIQVSATLQDLPGLNRILKQLKHVEINNMIDLGCGYGGVTKYVAKYLNIPEIYGIDMDESRLSQAQLKGVNTYNLDLSKDSFPFPDSHFNLVISNGVLEHLVYFDNFFSESFRILMKSGYMVLAMPNLGSYVNRVALLLGYQPRDVEISLKISPGILPVYPRNTHGLLVHIHSATFRAIKEMMEYYGFKIEKAGTSPPYQINILVKVVDKVFSLCPSLSRRFIILARKL